MFDLLTIGGLIKGGFVALWTVLMAVLGWNWNKLDKRVDFIDNKFDKRIDEIENKVDAMAVISGGLSRDNDDVKKSIVKLETQHDELDKNTIRKWQNVTDNMHEFRNKATEVFLAKDEYFRNQAKTDKILDDLPKRLAAENRQLLEDLGLIKK
jgi:hypothetical protein